MRILSVYYGHDANCTLLEDGKPVIVLEKERRSRIKHDQGMMDLEEILEQYGWDPATIDVIAINTNHVEYGAVVVKEHGDRSSLLSAHIEHNAGAGGV